MLSACVAVPVILEVIVPGNLASLIVPDEILDAFNDDNPEPEPLNVPAVNVLVLGHLVVLVQDYQH